MQVICISAHAMHGKDTVAEMMNECLTQRGQKVLVTHYADLVKYICKNYYGWDGKKDEHGRSLLQYVGTDLVRAKNPNYWVDFVADRLEDLTNVWDCVLIPDTRFPNEIQVLKDRGFSVNTVRVQRVNFESPLTEAQKKHPSETALDDYKFDYVLINDTIDQLVIDVERLCDEIIAKETEYTC